MVVGVLGLVCVVGWNVAMVGLDSRCDGLVERAEAILAAIESGDREVYAAFPQFGGWTDDEVWDLAFEAIRPVDMSTGSVGAECRGDQVLVEFAGGWHVSVFFERVDGEWAFVPLFVTAIRATGPVSDVSDRPDLASALAVVEALARRDREAFDALVSEACVGGAYATSTARVGDVDLSDVRIVETSGVSGSTHVTVRSADGMTIRVDVETDDEGTWGLARPLAHADEETARRDAAAPAPDELARSVLAALAARDREAFADLPVLDRSERLYDRSSAMVAHIDVAHPLELVEPPGDPSVRSATFADGWELEIRVFTTDDGTVVSSIELPYEDGDDVVMLRSIFGASGGGGDAEDDPRVATVLTALRAAQAGDRVTFDGLLADEVPDDAYATTRDAVRAFGEEDVASMRFVGTDDAVVAELRPDAFGASDEIVGYRIVALRRDGDGPWRLVSPIVD